MQGYNDEVYRTNFCHFSYIYLKDASLTLNFTDSIIFLPVLMSFI